MSKEKKKIRQKFREDVFKRDKNQCVFCGEKNNLDAHHITDRNLMPNGGYVKSNGITVCSEHHLLCEQYHINNGQSWPEGYHPDDLYRKIKASYAQAVADSNKL